MCRICNNNFFAPFAETVAYNFSTSASSFAHKIQEDLHTMESSSSSSSSSSSGEDISNVDRAQHRAMIQFADLRAIDGILAADDMSAAVRATAQLRMTGQQLVEYLQQPRKFRTTLALPTIDLSFRCSKADPQCSADCSGGWFRYLWAHHVRRFRIRWCCCR